MFNADNKSFANFKYFHMLAILNAVLVFMIKCRCIDCLICKSTSNSSCVLPILWSLWNIHVITLSWNLEIEIVYIYWFVISGAHNELKENERCLLQRFYEVHFWCMLIPLTSKAVLPKITMFRRNETDYMLDHRLWNWSCEFVYDYLWIWNMSPRFVKKLQHIQSRQNITTNILLKYL